MALFEGDAMTLRLKAKDIEFIYDDLDTNALNFILRDGGHPGYFCFQAGVFLEEDEQLNEPYLEWNGQENARSGGIEQITFLPGSIQIQFPADRPYLGKYGAVEIVPPAEVTREIVDFFNNYLYLGELTRYAPDFDLAKICPPVAARDHL